MQFLPIVERELRVAARQSRTWWRRALALGVGVVAFGLAYLSFGQWASSSWAGEKIFVVLSLLGFLYALLAGPMTTADCLSRERREGTLGLLFLTDLKSRDVVFGKLVATSLDIALGLLVALPLVGLPFLMGGLGLAQFARVAAALGSVMVLSLAVGVWASSVCLSSRAALGLTLGILLFLTVGLPMSAELLGISPNSPAGPLLLAASPFYTMFLSVASFPRVLTWALWLNVGCVLALAALALALACWRTRWTWREAPAGVLAQRLRRLIEWLRKPRPAARAVWRGLMLERNPVAWLEGRDLLQERLLWGFCLVAMIVQALSHLADWENWPSTDWVIGWSLWSHYLFCLWMAIQTPRRLAEDKASGALELLLCTDLPARDILNGNMLLLRRRFGRAFFILLSLDVFLLCAHFAANGGWAGLTMNSSNGLLPLACYGVVVFTVQAWCLARVGLYQGLVSASRATLVLAWKVGVLPWLLFITAGVTWESAAPSFGLPRMSSDVGFAVWAALQVATCGVFLVHANWHLHRHFRALASSTHPGPRWKGRLRPSA